MENKLQVIVKDSGLEASKAKIILEKFQDSFELVSQWEKKAKEIKVTDALQTEDMATAREGRLFLRKQRIDIENTRKALKEQALIEGRAIDGIANVLKALTAPIEEYLDKQEHFVEIQKKIKDDAKRAEIEKRMEEERIAEEKKEAKKQEMIRKENIRLHKEAVERERLIEEERKERDRRFAAEKAKADAKLKKEREAKKAIEEQAQWDKEKQELKIAAAKAKAKKQKEEAEAKAEEDRKEMERLAKIVDGNVECPECGHIFKPKGGK